VGYALARAAGARSRKAIGVAIGAANLPDIDFLLGYVANGDALSLHQEVITHRRVFPLLVGAATGLAALGFALVRGRPPTLRDVLRPAALATALVSSHLVMDRIPVPYQHVYPYGGNVWQMAASQAWNAVIDFAVYGGLATLLFERWGEHGRPA
jgi:hypothetical protein